MLKIKILFILFIPFMAFAQQKKDILGNWKVDNITFQLEDSLLQQAQINELEKKYENYYLEQEKNTTFSFLKNDSVYIKNEDIQKGTFSIEEAKIIILASENTTKSIYYTSIISPIYIELKTTTDKVSYSIFLKKITTQ